MLHWLDQHPNALFVILPLWFVFIWLMVLFILSYLSGWHTLATRFRAAGRFDGRQWRWQSGTLRWNTHFNNCLTLGSGQTGLYLATMWPFRFRHPPLLIPWSEIQVSRTKVLWWKYFRFELGHAERIPIKVRAKTGEMLREAAGANWPVERIE